MKKRILSLLLLGAMLISLAACTDKNNDDGKDSSGSDTTLADTNDDYAGIEKKNYEKDFVVLYPDFSSDYITYFFTEENTGEALDVALFNREVKIEEHLGVDIQYQIADNNGDNGLSAIYPNVQQMAMTGDNLYQMILTHCIQVTAVMATDGLLLDLNTVNSIDFDNEWWNHTANENLEVNGKQFYAISDYVIPEMYVVLFNKSMIDENKLESPYDLVHEGKWTIDKMLELSEAVLLDNGDGVWDVNDTYGFGAPSDHMLTAFSYSCGLTLVEKDEDGFFSFAFNSPKVYDVVDKLQLLFESPSTYHYNWAADMGLNGYSAEDALNIGTGRALFALDQIAMLYRWRNSEVDFGILPYPKFDENQEEYYSLDWAGLTCVPAVAEDHEMIGEVMELYGCLSSEEVLPAFYDIMLGEKLSRDPESREMLEIIFDGSVFDAGMNYFGYAKKNMAQFWNLPNAIATKQMTGYASFLEKYEEAAIAEIEEFNEAIADLEQ